MMDLNEISQSYTRLATRFEAEVTGACDNKNACYPGKHISGYRLFSVTAVANEYGKYMINYAKEIAVGPRVIGREIDPRRSAIKSN